MSHLKPKSYKASHTHDDSSLFRSRMKRYIRQARLTQKRFNLLPNTTKGR